jgi:hypothetical protein
VFEIPPSWRQPFACELQRSSLILTTTTYMTTQAINHPTALGATISWLSQAHLDCYRHGQAFLILQRETLALLAAQQLIGELAGGI